MSSRLGPSPVGVQIKIVGDEAAFARLLHPLLDDRMARGDGFDHGLIGETRAHVAARCGEMREVGQQIGFGDGG